MGLLYNNTDEGASVTASMYPVSERNQVNWLTTQLTPGLLLIRNWNALGSSLYSNTIKAFYVAAYSWVWHCNVVGSIVASCDQLPDSILSMDYCLFGVTYIFSNMYRVSSGFFCFFPTCQHALATLNYPKVWMCVLWLIMIMPSVPGTGSGSAVTLTRIKSLMKMNEWMNDD